ncbi:MAG: CDP-alcohol phosphatidyltransferase family protein, partial [Proteobacteria bacterium]|nr:CDP-alcohol phosphatidyltransferase family protein [Pseudomonadota bacterium]
PIGLMFAIERFILFRLVRSTGGKEWVQSKFWLHPNFISRCRFPMGVVSVILYHSGTVLYPQDPANFLHHAGVLFFAFWGISDMTDGTIARYFQLHTKEGESIDPLSDKLLIFPPLFYLAILDLLSLKMVLIFLVFDTIGTVSRYFIENKAANLFGKSKTLLAGSTPVLVIMQQMYYPGDLWMISDATLFGAVFLSFFSMFFKIIPNYWYANILSILNLICGIIGISLILFFSQHSELPSFFNAYPIIDNILSKNYLELAFALVFLGQFLDMFDGRAADKWGSTPKGELLDDLADGTNFGGTISFVIWVALQKTNIGILLGILHLTCTIFRLYRFIQNKRKAGVDGGVQIFEGLPSPAGALISGAVALLHINSYVKIGLIFGICFLMISKIKYIHFGRVILPAIPKLPKVTLLTLIILAVLFGLMPGNTQILFWMIFLFSFAYLTFGYNWKFYQNTAPGQPEDAD